MGKAGFEVSVPVTPSVFVVALHRVIAATRPPLPIDVSRLGTVVELRLVDDEYESSTVTRLHMAANSAGTVVTAEVDSGVYATEHASRVESLVRRTAEAIAQERKATIRGRQANGGW